MRTTGRFIAGNDSEDFNAGNGSGGGNKLREDLSSADERVEIAPERGIWARTLGDTGAERMTEEELLLVVFVFSVIEIE